MTVLVMVSARIKSGTGERFEQAFRQVRAAVSGTDGHLGEQLLRAHDDPHAYTLVGAWRSATDFLAWEDAPEHRAATTPMRPFWDGPVTRTIHEVAVEGEPAARS